MTEDDSLMWDNDPFALPGAAQRAIIAEERFCRSLKEKGIKPGAPQLAEYTTEFRTHYSIWFEQSEKSKILKDPPKDYMLAMEFAWNELIEWVRDGRFVPENEEDIQCFLYRGIVNHLGSAVGVRSKPTTDKPRSIFESGKLDVGDMHFPDFVLGEPKQVIAEIKFARGGTSLLGSCKKDVLKMKTRHDAESVKRVFILFDANPECIFLNAQQAKELQDLDPTCRLFLYPTNLNPHVSAAKKAWAKIRAKKV